MMRVPPESIVSRLILSAVLAASVPQFASAQSPCRDDESALNCLRRLSAAPADKEAAAASGKKAVADTKKKTETGVDAASGLGSSVKDFLPLLRLTGILGDFAQNDETGVVSVALNLPSIPGSGLPKDPSLQIRALIETQPKLFAALRQALPEATRDDVEKQLLGATDRQNFTLQASYNLTSSRFGRAFEQHMPLFTSLFNQSYEAIRAVEGASNVVFEAVSNIVAGEKGEHNMATTLWRDLPPHKRDAIASVIAVGQTTGAFTLESTFRKVLDQTGLNMFGQLVNNQPQIHFTLSRSFRDDLYGPTAWSGRAAYEIGVGNSLNAMKEAASESCSGNVPQDLRSCLAALQQFTSRSDVRESIKAGTRLSVFAEFTSLGEYAVSLPAHGVSLALEGSTAFSAGLDFGRLYGVDEDGKADARLDASVRYERPAETSTANRRFVASVNVTKKLGDVSVPFGVVYANKPEFLKDVDHVLGARVGLKVNLFDK